MKEQDRTKEHGRKKPLKMRERRIRNQESKILGKRMGEGRAEEEMRMET
jgi:hypothetical protein